MRRVAGLPGIQPAEDVPLVWRSMRGRSCQSAGMPVLARIMIGGATYDVKRAVRADVAAIVELIASDQIGVARDGGDLAPYERAFSAINADPSQLLVVLADRRGGLAGTLQLTFIPGLARRGALRAQIDAVRVHHDLRGRGLGHALFAWAIEEARRRDCALVQLTSDKRRGDAHRFYGRLGFTASHEGFKLHLTDG
jgi:GNAT superfamily N-acetyltransferase